MVSYFPGLMFLLLALLSAVRASYFVTVGESHDPRCSYSAKSIPIYVAMAAMFLAAGYGVTLLPE